MSVEPNILEPVSSKEKHPPLSVTHPELAKEADGWDPTKYRPRKSRVGWRCRLGHQWVATLDGRTGKDKTGCPICSGRVVLAGFNDLATKYPELAQEAFGWNPVEVSAGSNKKYDWRCSKGHIYPASIDKRAGKDKTGCPYCRNLKLIIGFNDLKTTHPEIAAQADGWDPSTLVFGTPVKMGWKCSVGHKWNAAVNSRDRNGCPVCSNQKIRPGINDILTTHPGIAAEAFGWDPSTVSAGNSKSRVWKCALGHKYSKTPANKILRADPCPVCSGRKVLGGFNDLVTTHLSLSREADGWDPTKVTKGSNKKVGWICSEGHRWSATINNRTGTLESGCPTCSKTGFDPNQEGFLYFLNQPDWNMYQIGITNNFKIRFQRHRKNGWGLLEVIGPMDGLLVRQWESSILKMLEAKGADLSNEKIAGRFDGYTEAWSKATFEVKSIKELMKLTEDFEDDSKV